MCATDRRRSSTAGVQCRSVRIDPKVSAPMILPPAMSGMVTFDLGPIRWSTALSIAASAGRSSTRENTMLFPVMTRSTAHGRSARPNIVGAGSCPGTAHECVETTLDLGERPAMPQAVRIDALLDTGFRREALAECPQVAVPERRASVTIAPGQDELARRLLPHGLPATAFVARGMATLHEHFVDGPTLERFVPPLLEPAPTAQ
jgi:hypothetical protein